MRNIVDAIIEIVNAPQYMLKEYSDSKELGRVNRVDPLGITSLRIRGMWTIENPFTVFDYLYRRDVNKKFNFFAIIGENKAASLKNFGDLEKLQQEKKGFCISNAQIKSPDNPAILRNVKLITYSL